jgi:hypothetical protein
LRGLAKEPDYRADDSATELDSGQSESRNIATQLVLAALKSVLAKAMEPTY